MKSLLAIAFATVYGLATHFMFVFLNNFLAIMSITFLGLLPVSIGFLTVALTPKEKITSGSTAFFKPWFTCGVLLGITVLLKMEGIICWLMIYPLFATLAGFGGLIAYHTLKRRSRYKDSDCLDDDDWEKPDTLSVSLALLAPIFIGLIEGDRASWPRELYLSKTVTIAAVPTAVWSQLAHINEVGPKEKHTALANFLGFPRHLCTTLDTLAVGGKRMAYYENGLYFKETIVQLVPAQLLVLDVETDPEHIPPTVLDEHIVIGGKHIDILQDVYRLEQLPDGNTRLTLSSRFHINTPFNWYASIWAEFLMSDILQGELDLIKARATPGF